MNVNSQRTIIVGVEDDATAGIVATAAAHVAMEQDATGVVLVHVIDTHTVAGGLMSMSGIAVPVVETHDDQDAMLSLAEAAFKAEYLALNRPLPPIHRRVHAGTPSAVIAQVAEKTGACAIVLGARRPHAFGRLVHPDVRKSLSSCTKVPVHVVPLQAETPA